MKITHTVLAYGHAPCSVNQNYWQSSSIFYAHNTNKNDIKKSSKIIKTQIISRWCQQPLVPKKSTRCNSGNQNLGRSTPWIYGHREPYRTVENWYRDNTACRLNYKVVDIFGLITSLHKSLYFIHCLFQPFV